MNKMDLFDGMRDFARTYGALCWNLSRSLQTKDMPHIYTTVLPNQVREDCALPLDGFASALLELESYIAALPRRRVDSVLSLVIDEARSTAMRTKVCERLRRRVSRLRWGSRLLLIFFAGVGAGASWYLWDNDWDWNWLASVGGGSLLLITLAVLLPGWLARWREHRERDQLDALFREEYRSELNQRDHAEDLGHLWQRVQPGLRRLLVSEGLGGIGRVSRRRLKKLEHCIEQDLRNMRSL